MNFTDVVTEVLNIVKRPDKILDVRREVNSAINQFCLDANWDMDVTELNQPVADPTQYSFSLPLTTFTRFRKFSYIRYGGGKTFIKRLERGELLKTDCDYRNKYYIAGPNVNINVACLQTSLDIGYYSFPPILTDAAPTFWMLDMSPFMVIDRAAAKIFTSIGDGDSALRHERYAVSSFLTAQKDYGNSVQ